MPFRDDIKAVVETSAMPVLTGMLLRGFPADMKKKGLRAAVTTAGRVVIKAARKNMPVETGLLKKSIGQRTKVYKREEVGVSVIGPRSDFKTKIRDTLTGKKKKRRPSKYLHLLEYGTRPHIIRDVFVGGDRFAGQQRFVPVIQHPGIRPKRPLTRAWTGTLLEQQRVIQKTLFETMKKTAKKRKKGRRGRRRRR
jgi:HK97 gp10 family phage protein